MRFFTWRSFAGLAYRSGWLAERRAATGLPLEILDRQDRLGLASGALVKAIRLFDGGGRAAWPSLFAYQYVALLSRDPARVAAEGQEADTLDHVA
jgi:hypothetical protein